MKRRTRERLDAMNRRFYATHADAFAASRNHPWPGWRRALALAALDDDDLVVDVACGNGRFARFLADEAIARVRYRGFDSSHALLTAARRQGLDSDRFQFTEADVVLEPAAAWLAAPHADWITGFGILHHVPGREARGAWLRGLAGQLRPGGMMCVAVWRFGAFERFRDHVVPWSAYNAEARDPVDTQDLETGDMLLDWRGDARTPRYCHDIDGEELEALVAAVEAEVVERFDADGREGALNHYIVWRSPA